MGLDAALDRFWEAAAARQLGVDAIQVVADNGPHAERRRIDDIRRDVFSVSKTVTSLAVGMLEGDGASWRTTWDRPRTSWTACGNTSCPRWNKCR
jgi:CubicO group peptidase (beta-lactamase class C family)